MCALWLLLVVFEMLCPIVCDEDAGNVPGALTSASVFATAVASKYRDFAAGMSTGTAAGYAERVACHDECLCRSVAIVATATAIAHRGFFPSSEPRIGSSYANPSSTSPPPPYHPPKIS